MSMRSRIVSLLVCGFVCLFLPLDAPVQESSDSYLSWDMRRAEAVGRSTYGKGRVGTWSQLCFHCRLLKTERATGYKLRATWFTPEVIRASARQEQIKSRLSDDQIRALVHEAEAAGDTIVMVEIDPDEGSGVVPLDWDAFLGPRGGMSKELDSDLFVSGVKVGTLRKQKALQGVRRRNYDYDRFWIVFPLVREDGTPLFSSQDKEAALVVSIYERDGIVRWPIPASIRQRIDKLSKKTSPSKDPVAQE